MAKKSDLTLEELNKLPTNIIEAREQNSQFFFTRIPCKNGHLCKRLTSCNKCAKCVLERSSKPSRFNRDRLIGIVDDELFELQQSRKIALETNQLYYFNGKKCRYGHISKRFSSSGECVICSQEDNSDRTLKIKQQLTLQRSNLNVDKELLNLPINRQEAKLLGVRFYFTGIPCKKGHLSKRYNGKCCECEQDYKFKLNRSMSRSITESLRSKRGGKRNKNRKSWRDFVDFTIDELIKHLELQFDEFMTWDNYGCYWHIDHIKPLSLCTTFKEAWNLNNLQPLSASDNISKNNKYIGSPKDKIYVSESDIFLGEWPDMPFLYNECN